MTFAGQSAFSNVPSDVYQPADEASSRADAAHLQLQTGRVNDLISYRIIKGVLKNDMVLPPSGQKTESVLHIVLEGAATLRAVTGSCAPLASGMCEIEHGASQGLQLHAADAIRILSWFVPQDYIAALLKAHCGADTDCAFAPNMPDMTRRFPISLEMKSITHQMEDPPCCRHLQPLFVVGKYTELLALALNRFCETPEVCSLSAADISCLNRARRVLEKNLSEPPSLIDLAREVGINDFKLKKGFRELFKTTPYAHLRKCRMIEARRILERSERSVTDIANEVGYSNLGHFAAAFRKQYGVTPREFKKKFAPPRNTPFSGRTKLRLRLKSLRKRAAPNSPSWLSGAPPLDHTTGPARGSRDPSSGF